MVLKEHHTLDSAIKELNRLEERAESDRLVKLILAFAVLIENIIIAGAVL